jgi:hypothetical protein
MLNYDDLTTSQKKWVDLVIMLLPEIGPEITWTDLHTVHDYYFPLRADKKFKIGFPNWLIRNNALRHGAYHFPKQGNILIDNEELDPLEINFREEIGKYGIVIER